MPARPIALELESSDDVAATAHRVAEEVLRFLERERIPPTPLVYRVFYEYVTGDSAILSAVIEGAMRASEQGGRRLAEAIVEEFSEEAASDATFAAAAGLAEQIATLDGGLATASSVSRSYSGELGEAGRMLGDPTPSQAALGTLLRSLLGRHRALLQTNATLRIDLDQARGELETTQQQLSQAARDSMLDPVTGLANRRGAEGMLGEVVAAAQSDNTPFSLIMIDIDRFKALNDSYGHQAGDRVLHEVARALIASMRVGENVFRFGGDEFAAIVFSDRADEVGAAAERLRQAVTEINLARCVGGDIVGNVTISLGAASFRRDASVSALFERADRALFEAKRAGRNRWAMARD